MPRSTPIISPVVSFVDISNSPWIEAKYFPEAFLEIVTELIFTNSPGYVISLATLFLFVLMKILPSMMKMSYALQNLAFSVPFIEKIPLYGTMQIEELDNKQVSFTQSINLLDVS